MTALQYTNKTDKELNMKPVADNFRHTKTYLERGTLARKNPKQKYEDKEIH